MNKILNVKCGNPKCQAMLRVDVSKLNPKQAAVRCPKCKNVIRINLSKPEPPQPPPKPESKAPQAWLIRHTEGLPTKTFPLKLGKNKIGRRAVDPSYPIPDVAIIRSEDARVSRGAHCILEVVEQRGLWEFILSDNKSSNGTFINNKEYRLQPGDEEYIEEGETIQVGRTKFVLKTNQNGRSAQQAQDEVGGGDYTKTIIV